MIVSVVCVYVHNAKLVANLPSTLKLRGLLLTAMVDMSNFDDVVYRCSFLSFRYIAKSRGNFPAHANEMQIHEACCRNLRFIPAYKESTNSGSK